MCHEGIKNTVGLTNSITTTKYSIFTWLPKSLWEQFRRIANVYFLVISVLMVRCILYIRYQNLPYI